MTTTHVVKRGEHLPGIADRYGFGSHKTLWDDPANAALKQQRRSAEILAPGDEVVIPEKDVKAVAAQTGLRHTFVVVRDPLELRLRMHDLAHRPLVDTTCTIAVGGADEGEFVTDDSGTVVRPIRRRDASASLIVGAVCYEIAIGELDPIEEASGWQARLINLGYLEGPLRAADDELSDDDARELRAALEEFQCDHGLSLTGQMDNATRGKLLEVHGC